MKARWVVITRDVQGKEIDRANLLFRRHARYVAAEINRSAQTSQLYAIGLGFGITETPWHATYERILLKPRRGHRIGLP